MFQCKQCGQENEIDRTKIMHKMDCEVGFIAMNIRYGTYDYSEHVKNLMLQSLENNIVEIE